MNLSIGSKIPNLAAHAIIHGKTVEEHFSLGDLEGKYTLLFFYPLDFTFICPTELHAFQDLLSEFEKRDCAVIGCSVDSHHSHLAWLETPIEKGGIKGVTYTLLSDITKQISKEFGVLNEEKGITYRATFLIDKQGIIRHYSVNDFPLGRNVEEHLRLLDALQFTEEHGEVCPANWKKGSKSMKETNQGKEDYFKNK